MFKTSKQKTNINTHPELKDGRHNEERRGYGHSEGPHEHNEIPGILIHTPQIQIQIENYDFDRGISKFVQKKMMSSQILISLL